MVGGSDGWYPAAVVTYAPDCGGGKENAEAKMDREVALVVAPHRPYLLVS